MRPHPYQEDLSVPGVFRGRHHLVHRRRGGEQHHHARQVVRHVGEDRRAHEAVARDVVQRLAGQGGAAHRPERLHGREQPLQVPFELVHRDLDSGLRSEHGQADFAGADDGAHEALHEGLEAEEALQGEQLHLTAWGGEESGRGGEESVGTRWEVRERKHKMKKSIEGRGGGSPRTPTCGRGAADGEGGQRGVQAVHGVVEMLGEEHVALHRLAGQSV
ncbi:hypothetical protein EYF80_044544 [Liparis tanakae]|uniref:Uncharacterized protein n=1 Tax=Liparis tanakae TaxID=230148 RepID=A0A4Z2FY74_9TELE|nr:hypothetical protein EYF80_044544 [Liparis tanakae]